MISFVEGRMLADLMEEVFNEDVKIKLRVIQNVSQFPGLGNQVNECFKTCWGGDTYEISTQKWLLVINKAFRENVCFEDVDLRDTDFWVDSEDVHMDDIS